MNTYTVPRRLDVAGALDALPAPPLDDRPDAQRVQATGSTAAQLTSLGRRMRFRPKKTWVCARRLGPMLLPASGKSCLRRSQDGTSGDELVSNEAVVTVAADAACASVSNCVSKPPRGVEPRTCGLQNRRSARLSYGGRPPAGAALKRHLAGGACIMVEHPHDEQSRTARSMHNLPAAEIMAGDAPKGLPCGGRSPR
jgi:hypothetical protein